MIAIICALDIEIESILSEMEDRRDERAYGYIFAHGKFAGQEIVAVKCGVGKVNAAVCAQTLIMKYAPDCVFNTGTAGSLSRELGLLDIAIARDIVQHDVDTTGVGDEIGFVSTVEMVYFPLDGSLATIVVAACAKLGIPAKHARIASGDQFVETKARRDQIVDTFKADACDMESGAIAQVCHIANIPCCVIRAISDASDDAHGMEFAQFAREASMRSVAALRETLRAL